MKVYLQTAYCDVQLQLEQLHYVKTKFAVPAYAVACCSTDSKATKTTFLVSCPLLEVDEWLTWDICRHLWTEGELLPKKY